MHVTRPLVEQTTYTYNMYRFDAVSLCHTTCHNSVTHDIELRRCPVTFASLHWFNTDGHAGVSAQRKHHRYNDLSWMQHPLNTFRFVYMPPTYLFRWLKLELKLPSWNAIALSVYFYSEKCKQKNLSQKKFASGDFRSVMLYTRRKALTKIIFVSF